MATKPRHLKTPIQLWVMDNRKRLGLSSLDLANLTGVDEDTARGWESRGRPGEDALRALERRFGVPVPEDRAASGDQSGLAGVLAEQNGLLRQQIDAINRNAKATEELVKALGARMDRLEEDRQRDFAALVDAIGKQLAPVIVGLGAGASDGSPDPSPVSDQARP